MRILIVDDDPNLRALCARVLAEAGHEVTAAADSSAGVVALSGAGPAADVVLLDLRLWRDNGVEVVRAATRLGGATRIVLVAGTHEATRAELFDCAPGVAAVLRKPVDLEALLAAVEGVATADLARLRAEGRAPRV